MESSMQISYSRRSALRAHQQYAMVLNTEWQHLTHQAANVERANSWNICPDAARSLDDVLTWVGYRGLDAVRSNSAAGLGDTTDDRLADDRLGSLVRVARDGDQLAGRIVLQRIIPGLRARARRWADGCAPAGIAGRDVFAELVAAAWDTIIRYQVDRRPRHIAGNLIADTVGRTLVAPTRRRAAGEQSCDPELFGEHADAGAGAGHSDSTGELVDVLIDARRAGVDRQHIELFCDLWQADGSTDVVASRHGVTARTIRSRRATAARVIRGAIVAA